MTHVTEPLDASGARQDDEARRAAAFRAAGRHSARVRRLKRAMVLGSTAAVAAIVVFTFFNPFAGVIPKVSVSAIDFNGSKIVMELPRLAGFRTDGRPYTMKAQSLTQDLHKATAFDLIGVEGTIGMADKSSANITAKTGTFDNSANAIDLEGDVHVKNDAGYEAFMESAHIDFKTSAVVSNRPVRMFMNTTTVTANSLNVIDSGKAIIFEGHVKTRMLPAKDAEATTAQLKGAAP